MDAPDATTHPRRGKITGRTAGGMTVGLLDAVTNRETRALPSRRRRYRRTSQEVEPLSNYFIGRVRKDFRGGATRIGTITRW